MKNINLLVADDHPMIRNGVRLMLENQTLYKFNIIEASSGEEALSIMKNSKMDVLVLDISMNKMSGMEVLKTLRQAKNKTPIIIQSMHDEAPIIKQTLELGAKGYVLKLSDHNELLNAIDHALQDKTYFSQDVSAIMFASTTLNRKNENIDNLTNREIDVIIQITKGLNNQQIANKLFISKRTVEGHKKSIYDKTNTHSTQTVIIYSMKNKLI